MPFLFGEADGANVVLLESEELSIDLGDSRAGYLVFVHVVEDATDVHTAGWARDEAHGDQLGRVVAEYELSYADGSIRSVPIVRRFAIQQARCTWGSAPFACVPAAEVEVVPTADEALAVGRAPLQLAPVRVASVAGEEGSEPGLLWIYALKNPEPDVPLRALVCRPREERSAIYALTLTDLAEHPLQPGVRRKLRVPRPEGVTVSECRSGAGRRL